MNKKIKFNDIVILAGRIFALSLFIWAGFGKMEAYHGTAGYMQSIGVPTILLPLVILLEFFGGISIVFGFLTKFTSYFMSGFTILAAIIFHHNFSDATSQMMFMKDLSITGGLLFLAANGAGKLSIDHIISSKRNKN